MSSVSSIYRLGCGFGRKGFPRRAHGLAVIIINLLVKGLHWTLIGSLRREKKGPYLLLIMTWPWAACPELGRRSPASDQFGSFSHFSQWVQSGEERGSFQEGLHLFREQGLCRRRRASLRQLFTQRSITPLNCILHQFAISLCAKFHSSALLSLRSDMTGLCFLSSCRDCLWNTGAGAPAVQGWELLPVFYGVRNFLCLAPGCWCLQTARAWCCHRGSPLMWWLGGGVWEVLAFWCCRWCFSLGTVRRLLVSWFVLLFTSSLHERVRCSHAELAKET